MSSNYDNTVFGQRGEAPLLTEQFDTIAALVFTNISGQLTDTEGLRFHLLADPDNSNSVFIGGNGTITFPMEAGLGITMEVENLNQIYANVQAGDGLHVLILSETSQD